MESTVTSDMLPIYGAQIADAGTKCSMDEKGEEMPSHLPVLCSSPAAPHPRPSAFDKETEKLYLQTPFCSQLPCVVPDLMPIGGS